MPKLSKLSPPKSSLWKGAGFLLAAWIFGTVMTVCAKQAEIDQVSIWNILCVQGLISFALGIPIFVMKYPEIQRFRSWLYIILRSVLSIVGIGTMFIAAKYAKLVNVLLLTNTSPIFIPLIALVWFKTKIPWKMWASIFVGFVGIIFVLRPDHTLFAHPGILYAVIPGISLSFSQIYMRLMADRKETAWAILFFYFVLMIFMSLPGAVITWKHIDLSTFWYLLGGGIANFAMQVSFLKAFSFARPVQIGPLNYSAVVFSYIAGSLLWSERISLWGLIGILLVVAGGITTLLLDKKTKLKPKM